MLSEYFSEAFQREPGQEVFMKKSPKFVLKAAAGRRSAGGTFVETAGDVLADLHLDPESVKLFAGISASTDFTAATAHRAFAGLKRRK